MTWLKNILIKLAMRNGIKPVARYLIELLEERAFKSETKLDDAGVRVLSKVVEANEYTTQSMLLAATEQLVQEAKLTTNVYDDFATELLHDIVQSQAYNKEQLQDVLIKHLRAYAASTDTPVDDLVIDSLEIILKELKG